MSWKILSGILFYSSLSLLLILLLLQLTPVQTYLARKVLNSLSERTDHEISIDKLRVSWLNHVELTNVMVFDLKKDTMIFANKLSVDYDLIDLMRGEYLHLSHISSVNIMLHLVKYDSSSKLNISEFLSSLNSKPSNSLDSSQSKAIKIDQIELDNFHVRLIDKTKPPTGGRVDFSNLDFQIPGLDLSMLRINSDTITGSMIHLSGVDLNSGFEIKELKTVFFLSNNALSLDDLTFETPTSHVSDSIEFFYNGLDDFSYFVDSVSFIFHFKDSKISKSDIRLVTGIEKVSSDIELDGIFWGTVGDFNIEEARIGFGSATFFEGGVSCFGLPDINQTFILADITNGHLLPDDLKPYVGEISDNLGRMGEINFQGSFAGFIKDFVAKGDFYTDQGSIHSDINIKIPEDASEMSYVGNLELDNVNVGTFLKNDVVQNINLKAQINGKGITPDNADFNLNAVVFNSGLRGYVYDTVKVNGHFAKNFFEGNFKVQDPNCKLVGVAEVDIRSTKQLLSLDVDINKIQADQLNLTDYPFLAKGLINLSLDGFDIDSFTALLTLDSGLLAINDKKLVLNSIRFNAGFENDSTRHFEYEMPGLQAQINGRFKITDVLTDLPNVAEAYASKLQLIERDTLANVGSGQKYKLTIDLMIDDISPYLDSLEIPVKIYNKAKIEASFRQGTFSNLSVFIRTDSVQISGISFHDPIIEVNGSADEFAKDVLTNFIIRSQKQIFKGAPPTEDLLLEGVWFDNNIDITTELKQPGSATDVSIESNIRIAEDSIVLKMLPSDILVLDDNWTFNPTNQIVIKANQIKIDHFEIYDSSESIRLSGIMADSTATSIDVVVEELNMNKANLFIESDIKGYLSGNFELFRDNSLEDIRFDGAFFLKGLQYGDLLMGDISGTSNWNPATQSIYSSVEVIREDFKSIEVKGYYYPGKETDQLDFDLLFDQADLAIAKPFVEKNFAELRGQANGSLKISGNPSAPRLVGRFGIQNGGVKINYLNTTYSFSGEIDFDPNKINLRGFDLTDRKGSKAYVTGSISHRSFSKFITNINIRSSNFEFLNTTSLDNELYYGSAYGTGTVNVKGPLEDLVINANIKTASGTRFFIPISESNDVSQEEFIEFLDFSDTTKIVLKEEGLGIKGLTMDFDIEVTPDAYCELIFDIKKGDIIRGRGSGNIKLTLSTDGDFSMFGPLEITQGAYNFTLSNIVNKEFDVVPGSRITWYGDPYDATLNLEATYLQRASLEQLNNEAEGAGLDASNRVPVLAVLYINGSMLSPTIDFDIRLQNEGDVDDVSNASLTQIRNDEQELRRQFMSLLFLKRFSPRENFFNGSGGVNIGSSVSEILSNQVSYLFSQIDENLEIEVNLADLDQEAFNTLQLRLAYTFFDGRLKVTRGGSFNSENDQEQNVLDDIVGDWSVEYSLTRDGRLRLKVFRNTNERLLANGNQNQEAGVSLRFVHSFDDLKELLSAGRKEAIRRKEEEEARENVEEDKLDSDSE